jgi:O-acetyl-ADP-ribose deacetylase (regulator of RNase III)
MRGVGAMIQVQKGDLFESDAQTLVNAVNCVGVMGKGVALEFRKRFPDMYADYLERCKAGQVRLGEPYVFRGLLLPWILNFPTKDDWRSASKLSDIVNGLGYLACHYKEWGIESLAVPALGCGAGHLEWEVVGPVLYRELEALDLDVHLYAPFYVPDEQATVGFLRAGAQKVVSGDAPSSEVESRRAPRLG